MQRELATFATDSSLVVYLDSLGVCPCLKGVAKAKGAGSYPASFAGVEKVDVRKVASLCGQCGKEDSRKKCSRCKACFYCSADCQRKHWKSHKKYCKAV